MTNFEDDDEEWGNLTAGGLSHDEIMNKNWNKVPTKAERAKVSAALKGKSSPNKGRPSLNKGRPSLNKGRPAHNKGKPAHNKGKPSPLKGKPSPLKGIPTGRPPPNKGKPLSDETKIKLRKPRSEETKAKMRKPKPKIQCPHCGKWGGSNAMKRFHFDNCKAAPK